MQIETVIGTFDSNTYVCGFHDGVIIIDSGAALEDVIRVVGKRKVLAILVTHEHFDHLTHCVAYAKHFAAPVYGTREVLDNLKYYRPELPSEIEPDVVYPIVVYDPEIVFHVIADETPLTFGAVTVQPYICQGHSAGSVVFLIQEQLFTGDLLFARGIGNVYMTNGKKYLAASLARVQQLTFQMAYHGHGLPSDATSQAKNIQVWLKWLTR